MGQRTIAVGDIHGCATAFRALLEALQPKPDDVLVVLGDCVDRGPDSCDVIEQLLAIRDRCRLVCLFGNHEEMMIHWVDGRAHAEDWLYCGGDATLESYGAEDDPSVIPAAHVEFIRSWIDFWETPTHFFVHGVYHPEHPLAGQHWNIWRWYSLREVVPGPHVSGKTAVVGHTSQKTGEVLDLGHLKCIDTFCCGGGWLTAYDTSTDQYWQVNDDGVFRT